MEQGINRLFSNKYHLAIYLVLFSTTILASGADKILLVWNKNPETNITIRWDQVEGSDPIVYYGETDHDDEWEEYPYSQRPTRILTGSYRMNTHFAEISDLKPDHRYYFVIRDSRGTSRRFWFRTAPDKPKAFTFITGGDTKSFGDTYKAGLASNRLVAKLRPLFVLFNGDFNSGNGTYSVRWHKWLNDWSNLTTTTDGRMIPVVPVHGNHEDGDKSVLNKVFNAPFQYEDSTNIYYSITFGDDFFHIIGLNTQIDEGEDQRRWLENDLKKYKNSTFKIAGYHKPFHPHTNKKSENEYQYEQWAELFFRYGLNIAVEADAHLHKITYPLKPYNGDGSHQGFIRDDERGTMFIGEGSWGASPRINNDEKPWTITSGSFNQIKWIHVLPQEGDLPNHLKIYTVKSAQYDEEWKQTLFDHQVESLSEDNLFEIPEGITLDKLENYGDHIKYPFYLNYQSK